MTELSVEQIRRFRLAAHHLDRVYANADIPAVVGACGMQNSPPGAWETALFKRVPGCGRAEMERLLYEEKVLLQAWSLRGAPVVFPASESGAFLAALTAEEGEPWIYTQGIALALEFLQMDFDTLLEQMVQVLPQLDGRLILSKTALDQTIAEWILPLLPEEKRKLWNQPSMYGNPDQQTVGGAVVSFLLRPCAYLGLVVFGERNGISPTFTSYKTWVGRGLEADHQEAARELVRKYLHCYGPATPDLFVTWLGCSKKQGRRLWELAAQEMEPVSVLGKRAFILAADRDGFGSPGELSREVLLLGGHDPFLDQRDRFILQPDKSLHKQIWKLVSNPGAIVYRGEIIGVWTGKKSGNKGMEIKMTLWMERGQDVRRELERLGAEYAAFRGIACSSIIFQVISKSDAQPHC